LLAHLREADQERLEPHLQTLTLDYKRSLYRAHESIEFVYFIESGVASLVNTLQNGAAAEVGTIGNEGMVGLPVLLGETEAPTSVYVQVPGSGLRMSATIFAAELDRSVSLRRLMLRYAHAMFDQVAQSAACAHFHHLEQRPMAAHDA
jgi:CRP-like cAMP-binding protein